MLSTFFCYSKACYVAVQIFMLKTTKTKSKLKTQKEPFCIVLIVVRLLLMVKVSSCVRTMR